LKFKKGINKQRIVFTPDDTGMYVSVPFRSILKKVNAVAPGNYKMHIRVVAANDSIKYSTIQYSQADSALIYSSPLEKEIKNPLLKKGRAMAKKRIKISAPDVQREISKTTKKRNKAINDAGLTPVEYEYSGLHRIDLYYEGWFAGRYEIPLDPQKSEKKEKWLTPDLPVKNDLGSPSLFSQYKNNNKEKKKKEDIRGFVGVATYLSNGQEQNSQTDNNYYEIRGDIEVPVKGIPIDLQGLYTSQDKNRQVKSSYFRVHYDVDKVREALKESVGSYNNKFSETRSKNSGLQQVYSSAISNLESQRAQLERTTGADMSIEEKNANKEKMADLNKRIDTYKNLLAKAENTAFFDSALVYSKTKDINSYGDLSNKQIIKKGSEIFPEGRVRSFIAGITKFDAGMFPKDGSKYTTGGQMMKGVDAGYDIGFCELSGTVGKTEYIGRDGTPDRYTCYSGAATFKPAKHQKIDLIYYGYTPDKAVMSKDAFFKNMNLSAPGFTDPVHILSLNYTGTVTKYVRINSEAATSYRQTMDNSLAGSMRQLDKMAYQFNVDGSIPKTAINIEAAYSRTGKGFENSTLPLSLSGTEQLRSAVRSDLFRSLVTIGVEFNRLTQSSFRYTGSSTKWGFDLKTNLKRYPSLAVSYKPFTTFRSFTDTFSIPQKPLFGSVLTGKVSYQIKNKKRSWRLALLYSECNTVTDTVGYGNKLAQALCTYNAKKWGQTISVGRTQMYGTDIVPTMPAQTDFLSLSTNYTLNSAISFTCGQDLGWAAFGLSRLSPNGGFMCQFKKIPLTMRLCIRYNRYLLGASESWKEIQSGNIDVVYRIKPKTAKSSS
jgi:hypothetical protein